MSAGHAPAWFRGPGTLDVRATAPLPTSATVALDGRDIATRATPLRLRIPLRAGWHLVAFDVPHLAPVGSKRAGLTVTFRRS
jgi:hypothetical protein